MSAVTIVPGTQSASLARRIAAVLRLAVVEPSPRVRRTPLSARSPERSRAGSGADAARLDPLDDLRNATWEDAEWQ